MKVNDAISGALFLALSIFVFVHAGTFPAMRGVAYGPDLFPRIVAVIMGLSGSVLVIGALRPAGRQPILRLADWARQPRSYGIFAGVVVSMLFYIFASERLGFLLTAFLMLASLLLVTRGRARLVSSLITSGLVTALIYFLFARVLRVPLPYGAIESWLVG